MTANPADAVREAPMEELLATAMETEASLLVSIVGRSVSASDVTLLRQGAAVIREQSARLAALAGAAPDGQNFRGETFAEARQQLVNVLKSQKSWLTDYAEAYVDEFAAMATPHAPAKAREDGFGLLREVRTYLAANHPMAKRIDAALATFAKGDAR